MDDHTGNGDDATATFPGTMTHNDAAQDMLVGQMLRFPEVAHLVRKYLAPETFYGTRLQTIVSAIYDVLVESGTVDIVLVADRLRRNSELNVSGGVTKLYSLVDEVVSPVGALPHARVVLEYWICREVCVLGRDLMQIWDRAPTDVDEAFKASRKGFEAIEKAREILDNLKCHGLSAVERLNREMEER